MISVLNGKWRDKDGLRDLVDTKPQHVYLDGVIVRTNSKWSGYADAIPYGETLMVKDGGKTFGFKKRTDNTVEVF